MRRGGDAETMRRGGEDDGSAARCGGRGTNVTTSKLKIEIFILRN